MEEYTQYEILGSVKRRRIKPYCIPTRFNRENPSDKEIIETSSSSIADSQRLMEVSYMANKSDTIDLTCQTLDHQTTVTQESFLNEGKYDSDSSRTMTAESVDYESSPSKLSSFTETASDTSSEEEYEKVEKSNLQSTLLKIKNKPKLHIGLPKGLYFVVELIKKHTGIPKQHILLSLMKIKLNPTFSRLAEDFELSVTQVRNIFFKTMPDIVKVLSPFIKQYSVGSIKKNLPTIFRHRYNHVTYIINCLEIEIKKPTNAIHQALTWSEHKQTNTNKYLVACTPNGLVSFVSNGYAGSISDVNLLERSKFLESIQPGACILAGRGFKHLEKYLLQLQQGFVLLRLPSIAPEAKQSKQLASLRINAERVIRRLGNFGMFKPHSGLNSNLILTLDLCIVAACALINLEEVLIN